MAETALSLARKYVFPKLLEAVNMIRDLPKEVDDLTDALETFRYFINETEEVVEAEEDSNRRDRMSTRLMKMREATFRMEDVIDDYVICGENQPQEDPRCAALLCEAVEFIKTQISRLQIAHKIRDVKSLASAAKDGFETHFPSKKSPSNSERNQNGNWQKLRKDALHVKEDEVVGLDGPRTILTNWLTKGRNGRTVIFVVGIPGVGKTTLAKLVFDKVRNDFDCHASIRVSQSYNVEKLLRDMIHQLCKASKEDPRRNVSEMGQASLIEEVKDLLHKKRYVVLFDDLWNENFWNDIESALIDDNNKSRIIITTRHEEVAVFCKKSSFVEVHKLEKPLSEDESFRLFCRKAFMYGSSGGCPEELKDTSLEIVRKCKGLPLAIVAIGGVLAQKDENPHEWKLVNQNLSLEGNSELNIITKILGLSYHDLPINLKSCLLYFGMYPEDCEIESDRVIRQWVAEGFVRHKTGKTLEEVAEEDLLGLIRRNLVQVSSSSIDGKVKRCRVHDLIHDMILRKAKDSGFCGYIGRNDECVSSGIVRRLIIIAKDDLIGSVESSLIQSIAINEGRSRKLTENFVLEFLGDYTLLLSEDLVWKILENYTSLKVLDFEGAPLPCVPENLGHLIHLRYLSFRGTGLEILPKSIGKLQNLETLDIRKTDVHYIPRDFYKLSKLRHFLADKVSKIEWRYIGGMTSLQTIPPVSRCYHADDIGEVAKLKQLRVLRVLVSDTNLVKSLCSAINEMQQLEELHIAVDYYISEVIDLNITSPLARLRKLFLDMKLKGLPDWIPQLQKLVKLSLWRTGLANDELQSLKDMPSLLVLHLWFALEGETLHFQCGGFQKLKKLHLNYLSNLNSILIDRGALHSLEHMRLKGLLKLKTVPDGIQHLGNLKLVELTSMPTEFKKKIVPIAEQQHCVVQYKTRPRLSATWKKHGK
ncbi:disease resistance protein RPM1-like [Vigna unguiculata]|uniref:disease resistance protein RPM1-like n=1 Tax=Vigna unguiculata TaxID=3917 RepID=UPI001016EC4B|nr:disease resistance protein RPM1-like [Vigna unguiculata]